jgi:hypothetical protein
MHASITLEGTVAGEQDEKVRENKLRRMAKRQGLQLVKSRLRDRRAIGYGTYVLADDRNRIVAGERMSIDDVERYLTGEDD